MAPLPTNRTTANTRDEHVADHNEVHDGHNLTETHRGLTTTAHGGIVAGTDTRLTDARTPTGAAGGVLAGTYPDPAFAADMATQVELDAGLAARVPLSLVDAAGDLLVGTGPDALARLAKGAALDVLRVNGAGTALEYAAPAGGGGAMELIASTTLAIDAISIEFVSIPQTFRHLRLVFEGRSTGASSPAWIGLRFNDDAAANYDYYQHRVNGSTIASGNGPASTLGFCGLVTGAPAPAQHFGVVAVDLFNYVGTTRNKLFIANSWATWGDIATDWWMQRTDGRWRSMAAVNTLAVRGNGVNLAAGSTAWLYGIKGS